MRAGRCGRGMKDFWADCAFYNGLLVRRTPMACSPLHVYMATASLLLSSSSLSSLCLLSRHSFQQFPRHIDRHIRRYFERCGKVKQVFIQGSKCYVEFDPRGGSAKGGSGGDGGTQWEYTKRFGKVIAPNIPLAIYLAIRCWSAERRRFRALRTNGREERYARTIREIALREALLG